MKRALGKPTTAAPTSFDQILNWVGMDDNSQTIGGFQSRIGIPYSIGYETITSDENGGEVKHGMIWKLKIGMEIMYLWHLWGVEVGGHLLP